MVALDLATFQQSPSGGNVTGVIFLQLETGPYPEEGWSDFPVIILGWWTEAHLKIAKRAAREVVRRFMDGPYAATFSRADAPAVGLEYEKVKRSLLEAAEKVIAHCAEHKMSNPDLAVLRKNVEKLRSNQPVEPASGSRSGDRESDFSFTLAVSVAHG